MFLALKQTEYNSWQYVQDLDCAVDSISLGLQAKFGDKDQAQSSLRQRSLYREILKICPPVFYAASEAI